MAQPHDPGVAGSWPGNDRDTLATTASERDPAGEAEMTALEEEDGVGGRDPGAG